MNTKPAWRCYLLRVMGYLDKFKDKKKGDKMGFVENLAIVCFLCVAGCVFMAICAGLSALLSKFAPACLRDSFLGSVFGLEPESERGEITAADVMRWNARNVPANDE